MFGLHSVAVGYWICIGVRPWAGKRSMASGRLCMRTAPFHSIPQRGWRRPGLSLNGCLIDRPAFITHSLQDDHLIGILQGDDKALLIRGMIPEQIGDPIPGVRLPDP